METNGERLLWKFYKKKDSKNTQEHHESNLYPKSSSEDLKVCEPPHLKDFHKGQKAVLKRPLVVAVENERLQQLEDGEHIAEEVHVVLLPKLVHA